MDFALTAYISRMVFSLLLALGGVSALFIGLHLYKVGLGLKKDSAKVKIMNFEATSGSVGAVVMITSIVWALLSYKSLPIVTQKPDLLQITQSTSTISTIPISQTHNRNVTPVLPVPIVAKESAANPLQIKTQASSSPALTRYSTARLQIDTEAIEVANAIYPQYSSLRAIYGEKIALERIQPRIQSRLSKTFNQRLAEAAKKAMLDVHEAKAR